MKKLLVLAVAASLLSGCVSPAEMEQYRQKKAERVEVDVSKRMEKLAHFIKIVSDKNIAEWVQCGNNSLEYSVEKRVEHLTLNGRAVTAVQFDNSQTDENHYVIHGNKITLARGVKTYGVNEFVSNTASINGERCVNVADKIYEHIRNIKSQGFTEDYIVSVTRKMGKGKTYAQAAHEYKAEIADENERVERIRSGE